MSLTQTRFNPTRITRTPNLQKLAITVLSGGPSGEREISLQSGQAVARALETLGHRVYLEDINPNNVSALARHVDCVFVALHGRFGEDGQVQQILERRNLAYTGSGPEACRLAMNKADAKRKFGDLGIPTPRHEVVATDAASCSLFPVPCSLPPQLVVKPVTEGSSLHCYIIREPAQFQPAVDKVVHEYGAALVEEYIPGREITVAILGDKALPPIEIRTRRDFYDFDAKYVDEDTEYDFDITLPEDLLERIGAMSLDAHRALGCRDFSRLDWRVDDRCLKPYLLELNVIPGLTTHSLLPKAAARVGLPMPDLCQSIIDAAIKRKFSR
jgi:D-alanine-D-alanine ligase